MSKKIQRFKNKPWGIITRIEIRLLTQNCRKNRTISVVATRPGMNFIPVEFFSETNRDFAGFAVWVSSKKP